MDLFERIQLVSAVATHWVTVSYLLNRYDPQVNEWWFAAIMGVFVTALSAVAVAILVAVFYWVATGHALV